MSSREMVKQIFISHVADQDKKEAEYLSNWLKTAYKNVDVFVSSLNSIECGSEPMGTLVEGLSKTDALILLMTPAALQNFWVVFEAGFVFGKHRRNRRCHNVFPFVCKGAKISALPKPTISLMQAKEVTSEDGLAQALASLSNVLGQTYEKPVGELCEILSFRTPIQKPFVVGRSHRYEDMRI